MKEHNCGFLSFIFPNFQHLECYTTPKQHVFLEFLVENKAFSFSNRALSQDAARNKWLKKHWLLTTKFLGVPGHFLIDLTMRPPSGFETASPGLVIGKYLIISLLLHSNKAMYWRFKTWAEYDKYDISASYENIWLLKQGIIMSWNMVLPCSTFQQK